MNMILLRIPVLLLAVLALTGLTERVSGLRASFRLSRGYQLRCVSSPIPRRWYGTDIRQSSLVLRMMDDELTDAELEEILDEMLYSGDVEGCIRKRVKYLMNDNFLGFVEEKMEKSEDEDEKIVMKEIITNIEERITAAGGLSDSTSDFEKRLDKILFTPPNKRRQYIEEISGELSPAFLDYVKTQMQQAEDPDVKIVMATVLQIMGDTTGSDLLGRSKALLRGADGSLGKEFEKETSTSDVLQLGSEPFGDKPVSIGDRNDQVNSVNQTICIM